MDNMLRQNWYAMSIAEQISNIGSEVNRAIKWKNKGNDDRKINFCKKAIEFLELTISDPKNKFRVGELNFCIEELMDYFMGDNAYNTNDDMLMEYYDAFI